MNTRIDTFQRLVSQFTLDKAKFCSSSSGYTETEARVEFIDPLFLSLGWDMSNAGGVANSMKDVVREESQASETSNKRPDYTFRINGVRKFFVEAKKPAVDICTNKESAFQIRSYGWTAGMPISILTNFRTIRVYDTRYAPGLSDGPNVGLLLEFDHADYISRIDELLSLFGRSEVASGSIERNFESGVIPSIPISKVFLTKINDWRLKLANDLLSRYPDNDFDSINDIVQKLINRIIFIRMCEDRGIEGEERLRSVATKKDVIELQKLFKEMDERYNTGLFSVDHDPFEAGYTIDSQLFLNIVEEIYFPQSPYCFSVLDADFLGQVYEQFLVKRLALDDTGNVGLFDKPLYEDREIVTTPQNLVDEVVRRAVTGRLNDIERDGHLTYETLKSLKVMDIAVGSSRFLLRCFDEFVDTAIKYYVSIGDTSNIYERSNGDFRLCFTAKKELLSSCFYGIDIDFNAVEIARFSLLVKLLEEENKNTLPSGKKILPNLDRNIIWGNSVVENDFHGSSEEITQETKPLNWGLAGLPSGLDIIVCNPPYVKTEDMKAKTYLEFEYYKKKYDSPHQQFDKYFVFVENAIRKSKNDAWIGMVIPNKWITNEAGKKLRRIIGSNGYLAEMVDFGNVLLFEGKSTYICLLIMSMKAKSLFTYRHIDNRFAWEQDPTSKGYELPVEHIQKSTGNPWVLPANDHELELLIALRRNSYLLSEISTVATGLQTSAEKIFAINKWVENSEYIEFSKNGEQWHVEKSIVKPYLTDSKSRVKSYLPIANDSLVIFPYEYNASGRPLLIPPLRMKNEFPKAWNYLNANKQMLEKRDVQPAPKIGEYYSYGRHSALASAFGSPKIIYTVNQLGDKYGIDYAGCGYASGGTAGEVAISDPLGGYSLEFILAYLNQSYVEFFLRKSGSPQRGGYYSRGKAVLDELPIVKVDFSNSGQKQAHDKITDLTNEVIQLVLIQKSKEGRALVTNIQEIKDRKEKIKELFHQLFGVNISAIPVVLPGTQI